MIFLTIGNGIQLISDYNIFENVVRDPYAGVVWSHKIQEKQSDIYAEIYKCMETVKIIIASLTSVGIVAIIFTDPLWLKLVSAFVSFFAVYINAYYKTFDLQKMMSLHKATANRLIEIRDQYKILLTKIRLRADSLENLILIYENLVNKTDQIYFESPSTSNKAVRRASKALKINKDNTFSDEEIDSFLPESLRRCTHE